MATPYIVQPVSRDCCPEGGRCDVRATTRSHMYELDGEGRPESWATHCMQWMRLPLRQRCYYSSPSQPSRLTKIYEKLDISSTADTNRNYNIILDEINQAKNKYMMSKLVKFNKYKHKKSTWITQGLLASIRHINFTNK